MTGIYEEIWDSLPGLSRQAVEQRQAYAQSVWAVHGVAGLEAYLNTAAFLMNQAAASSPPGTFLPRSPEPTAAKFDNPEYHFELASLAWQHVAGMVTAGQMRVDDPGLRASGASFVQFGADALFWFMHWSGWALSDMAKRLSDDEFDRRVQSVIEELQDDD